MTAHGCWAFSSALATSYSCSIEVRYNRGNKANGGVLAPPFIADERISFVASSDHTTELKRCTKCKREYPATNEYFRNQKRTLDGFSTQCKICLHESEMPHRAKRAEKARQYRREHPERVRKNEQKRYWKDPEKRRNICRKDYRENHELRLAQKRDHYCRHLDEMHERSRSRSKEKQSEYNRRSRLKNGHKYVVRLAAWRKANPLKLALYSERRRAKVRSLPRTLTIAEWEHALAFFCERCAYCDCQQGLWNDITMDHVIPINDSQCKGTTADNIVPACRSCNTSKNDSPLESWLYKRFPPHRARKTLARIQAYFDSLA